MVDPEGVLRQATERDQQELLAAFRQQAQPIDPAMKQEAGLRKISLRALAAALSQAAANPEAGLPDSVHFLAGLQRIQYVLVYPERNDIVLAGPGEGWTVDASGNVVGITNGRPMLRVEDLFDRPPLGGRRPARGDQRFDRPDGSGPAELRDLHEAADHVQSVGRGRDRQGDGAATGQLHRHSHQHAFCPCPGRRGLSHEVLGDGSDEITGPGLAQLSGDVEVQGAVAGHAMPRWWMACNYQPLVRSDDRLVWEFRGPGVKGRPKTSLWPRTAPCGAPASRTRSPSNGPI